MKKQYFLLFAIAFALRLFVNVFIFIDEQRSFGFGADSESYEKLAIRMIEYNGYSVYPDSLYIPEPARPPGYPVLIWTFYKSFGQNPLVVTLFQVLLDSIIALLIFAVLVPISQTAGFVGGLIYALNLHQALYTTQLLSEISFTFFLFLSVLCLLQTKQITIKRIVISSLLLGIATHIRTIAIYFPIFICGSLFISKNKSLLKSKINSVLLYLIIFVSTITPWMIRNYKCFGNYFFSTIGDINIALWNAAPVVARIEGISEREVRERRFFEIVKEKYNITDEKMVLYGDDPRISALMRKEGLKIIFKNPKIYIQEHLLGSVKVFVHSELAYWARLFYGYSREELMELSFVSTPAIRLVLAGKISSALKLVLNERVKVLPVGLTFVWLWTSFYELIIYISGIYGALLLYRGHRSFFWLLMITIFYFAFVPGPVGDARFRVPIEPFLVILAGIGCSRILFNFRSAINHEQLTTKANSD